MLFTCNYKCEISQRILFDKLKDQSKYIAFRPIKSSATVPLKVKYPILNYKPGGNDVFKNAPLTLMKYKCFLCGIPKARKTWKILNYKPNIFMSNLHNLNLLLCIFITSKCFLRMSHQYSLHYL